MFKHCCECAHCIFAYDPHIDRELCLCNVKEDYVSRFSTCLYFVEYDETHEEESL